MKKFAATILLAGMLACSSMSAMAVVSPNNTPTTEPPGEESPKTGDINVASIGAAGLGCAVVALVAAKRRKDA